MAPFQHRKKRRVNGPQQASGIKPFIVDNNIDDDACLSKNTAETGAAVTWALVAFGGHANFISAVVQTPQTIQTAQMHRKKDEKFPVEAVNIRSLATLVCRTCFTAHFL